MATPTGKPRVTREKYNYWDSSKSKFWNEIKIHRVDRTDFFIGYLACLYNITIDLVEKIYYFPGIDPFQITCCCEYREKRRFPELYKNVENKENPYNLKYLNFEKFQIMLYSINDATQTPSPESYHSNLSPDEIEALKLLLNIINQMISMDKSKGINIKDPNAPFLGVDVENLNSGDGAYDIYIASKKYIEMYQLAMKQKRRSSNNSGKKRPGSNDDKNDENSFVTHKDVCLSLYHTTVTEFMAHMLSIIEVVDMLDKFLTFPYDEDKNSLREIKICTNTFTTNPNGHNIEIVSMDENRSSGSEDPVHLPKVYTKSTSSTGSPISSPSTRTSTSAVITTTTTTTKAIPRNVNNTSTIITDERYFQKQQQQQNENVTFVKGSVISAIISIARQYIIPVLFNTLWIIKNLSRHCNRVTSHHLGSLDPSLRLFTERGFRYREKKNIFKSCSETEAENLNDCLWRCTIKLGCTFNLFGISLEHIDFIDSVLSKRNGEAGDIPSSNTANSKFIQRTLKPGTRIRKFSDDFLKRIDTLLLSDFENIFVEEHWFSALGLVKNPYYFTNNNTTTTETTRNTTTTSTTTSTKPHNKFLNEKPILMYEVSDLWIIINMLSQKSCRLLDSPELRLFLTLIWCRLYNVFFCSDLAHEEQISVFNRVNMDCDQDNPENNFTVYTQSSLYLYSIYQNKIPRDDILPRDLTESAFYKKRKILTPLHRIVNGKPVYEYMSVTPSTKLYPNFFEEDVIESISVETGKNGIKKSVSSDGVSRLTISNYFSQCAEGIFNYLVELVSVSDYIYSIYPFETPCLPCDDFCERWLNLCNGMVRDDTYSDFVKKHFEERYWQMNQFYGESEKYNTNSKIAQRNTINSILVNNRFRHYTVINTALSHPCNRIFDFAVYRIKGCNTEEEMRQLFLSCWDHQKISIVKNPPSVYLRTLEKYKQHQARNLDLNQSFFQYNNSNNNNNSSNSFSSSSSSSSSSSLSRNNRNDISNAILQDTYKSFPLGTKSDDQEITDLIKAICEEQERVSKQYNKHSYGITSNDYQQEYIDPNSGIAPTSIIEKALEKIQSFRSVILDKERDNPDLINDPTFMARKIQYIPVGLVEYTLLQESIFTILSIRNSQINEKYSKNFGVLNNISDKEDHTDLIFTNPDKSLQVAHYDPKEGQTATGESIYDDILINTNIKCNMPIFDPSSLPNETKTKSSNPYGYDADDSDGDGDNGNNNNDDNSDNDIDILSYMMDDLNPYKNPGYDSVYEADEEADLEEWIDDGQLYLGMHGGSSTADATEGDYAYQMRQLNNEEIDDEEFGIGIDAYNAKKREKLKKIQARANKASGTIRDADTVASGLKIKEIPKEWPEIMNYDLLELRNQRNKENLETPLTIRECMCRTKRHFLFRRARSDKPCIFTFFNTYMLCNGSTLTAFSHPFETRRSENCPNLGIYRSPWEFSVVIGDLVSKFEENMDEIVSVFYSNFEEIQKKGVSERTAIVAHIQNFYSTFPQNILEATLDKIKEFKPTDIKSPIIVRELYREEEEQRGDDRNPDEDLEESGDEILQRDVNEMDVDEDG